MLRRAWMSRVCFVGVALGLVAGCSGGEPQQPPKVSTGLETPPAPSELGEASLPESGWVRVPWSTTLFTAPSEAATRFTIAGPDAPTGPDAGPRLRVLGQAEGAAGWWAVELGSSSETPNNYEVPGAQLYLLEAFVPAGTGVAVPAPTAEELPETSSEIFEGFDGNLPPGVVRPTEVEEERQIPAGTRARWPDGRPAGTVALVHEYWTPGRAVTVAPATEGEAPLELSCFTARFGPKGGGSGELCFAKQAVVATVTGGESVWGELMKGPDLDGSVSIGHGGLGMHGVGPSNTGPNYGSGLGTIGMGNSGSYGKAGREGDAPADNQASFRLKKLEVEGGVNEEAAKRLLRNHTRDWLVCHVNALGQVEGEAFTLELKLTGGSVLAVEAKGGGDPKVLACLLPRVKKKWRFIGEGLGTVRVTGEIVLR